MKNLVRTLLIGVVALLSVVAAGTMPASATSGDAANANIFATFPNAYDYDYLQTDMYVASTDITKGYFYYNAFRFDGDTGYGGYVGLQTEMYDCNGNQGGRGFVFTIWNVPNWASGGVGTGAYVCTGTEAGQPFVSVHTPYNWVTNHWYRFYLHRTVTGCPTGCYYYLQGDIIDITASPYIDTNVGLFLHLPSTWSWFLPNTGHATNVLEEYTPNSYSDCNNISVTRAVWSNQWLHSMSGGWQLKNAFPSTAITSGAGICTNSAVINWGDGVNYTTTVGATT